MPGKPEHISKALDAFTPQARHHYGQSKQIDALIQIGWGDGEPERGYLARMLFHTMLPHSAKDAREWMCQNGRVRLYIQAGPGMGLPYGSYPRLIFAWIVTEAFKTKDRTLVLGDSLSKFMRQLGLLPTGGRWGSITQLRDQLQRLLSSRMAAFVEEGSGTSMRAMQVANAYDLWWDPKSPEQAAIWESTVTLGQDFFKEIISASFPIDMRILRVIKGSSLAIDLYTMLTYRVSYLKQPTVISWRQLHTQFGSDYSGKYGIKEFTREAKKQLEKIRLAWPELNYETPRGRLKIYPGRPSVKRIN